MNEYAIEYVGRLLINIGNGDIRRVLTKLHEGKEEGAKKCIDEAIANLEEAIKVLKEEKGASK